MATLNPYLNFLGNTEEAFNFYKSVFGGEFSSLVRFKDTQEAEKLSDEDKNKLMHVALPIGDSVLMGTDALEAMGHKLKFGDNFSIAMFTKSEEETDKIFKDLSAGGKPSVPPQKMFWGDYWGMCTDKFGVQWMLTFVSRKQD